MIPGMAQTARRISGRGRSASRHWTATSRLFGALPWTAAASAARKGCRTCEGSAVECELCVGCPRG
jgi:hypothetical protein